MSTSAAERMGTLEDEAMSSDLLHQLPKAVGESAHVVAVFVDVRGFSSYAGRTESGETAIYLRKLYTAVLTDFISTFDFAKPTGDGLMIIRSFSEGEVGDVVSEVLESSYRLVQAYPDLFVGDPMLSHDLPEHLGVGIALGAATRLSADGATVDYSGRPLNLAARLMDLARPQGVVMDRRTRLAVGEITFAEDPCVDDNVHVPGIADTVGMEVHYWARWTVLPERLHLPVGEYEWVSEPARTFTLSQMRDAGWLLVPLSMDPAFPDDVKVSLRFPALRANRTRLAGELTHETMDAELVTNSDGICARINLSEVAAKLARSGVRPGWEIRVKPEYQVPKGSASSI